MDKNTQLDNKSLKDQIFDVMFKTLSDSEVFDEVSLKELEKLSKSNGLANQKSILKAIGQTPEAGQ